MDADTPWEKNSAGECAEVTTSLTVLDGNGIQPSDAFFSVVQDGILQRGEIVCQLNAAFETFIRRLDKENRREQDSFVLKTSFQDLRKSRFYC